MIDGDLTEFGESVADENAPTPFEVLRDKDLCHAIDALLEGLNDREKEIISRRFGFDGGEEKTLDEVGKQLGVSRERIRQLQNSALSKLRHALSQRENLSRLQIAA